MRSHFSPQLKGRQEAMKLSRYVARIASFITLPLLLSCVETEVLQGYVGPALSDDQVAIVRQPQDPAANIESIVDPTRNEQIFAVGSGDPRPGALAGTVHIIRLVPGTYRISYSGTECEPWCHRWVKTQRWSAEIALQAGHIYTAYSRSNCSFFDSCSEVPSIWFNDETSGQVVDDCSSEEMACTVTQENR